MQCYADGRQAWRDVGTPCHCDGLRDRGCVNLAGLSAATVN